MTYQEAVERWARGRFEDLPTEACEFDFICEASTGQLSEITWESSSIEIYLVYKTSAHARWSERRSVQLVQGADEISFGEIVAEIIAIARGDEASADSPS